MARPLDLCGDLFERPVKKSARRAQPRFGLRDLRLDHIVVAQRGFAAERHLVAGELDKGVERAARDAHRDPGKARGVELQAAEAVEQPGFAARAVVVARRDNSVRARRDL